MHVDGVQILKNSQGCFGVFNSGALSIFYFCRLPPYLILSASKRLSRILHLYLSWGIQSMIYFEIDWRHLDTKDFPKPSGP